MVGGGAEGGDHTIGGGVDGRGTNTYIPAHISAYDTLCWQLELESGYGNQPKNWFQDPSSRLGDRKKNLKCRSTTCNLTTKSCQTLQLFMKKLRSPPAKYASLASADGPTIWQFLVQFCSNPTKVHEFLMCLGELLREWMRMWCGGYFPLLEPVTT